jgi:hypothetical protein
VTINLTPEEAGEDGVEGVIAEGATEEGEERKLVEMDRTLENGHGKIKIRQAEAIITASGVTTRRWRELEDCHEPVL